MNNRIETVIGRLAARGAERLRPCGPASTANAIRGAALPLLILPLLLTAGGAAAASRSEGVHCSTIIDQDGDEAVLLESEWISMHLLPRMQAIINRFVFRPTGNDIVEPLQPKVRLATGGGILMDCLWEQDWRFQELKEKPYPYRITQTGPEEGQVVFETDITGWIGGDNSGVISRLLSNLTLRRTVTLRSGQPFFRFDFEFITRDGQAKRPTFWPHNASVINRRGDDETMLRPSARGLQVIQGSFGTEMAGEHYIHDFNEGWSTRISPSRREGIVYLMDYDYVEMLYNCGTTTAEWMYDGILATRDAPWKGRIYILPIIGLSWVHYANEYVILELRVRREEGGRLRLEYLATSSYEPAARITFNTEVLYNLLDETGEPDRVRLAPVAVEGLSIQPSRAAAETAIDAPDPLVFNITAYIELPDGAMKTYRFQKYYSGEYDSGQGLNRRRDGSPVHLLERPVRRPRVPDVPAGLSINRNAFNVFAVLGLGSHRMGVPQAIRAMPDTTLDIGYCSGSDAYGYGLTDFPYDYDRLFDNRVLVIGNSQPREFRAIGAAILMPWLEQGGGLVLTGGEHAFSFEFEDNPFNAYVPIKPRLRNLRATPRQLQAPDVPGHPIFAEIDLGELPWLPYVHDIEVKAEHDAHVLMRIGEHPFIVEQRTGEQITMVVAANHFGTDRDLREGRHLRHWDQWPKLLANIVAYAGGKENR